jgi:hypothetical protein
MSIAKPNPAKPELTMDDGRWTTDDLWMSLRSVISIKTDRLTQSIDSEALDG